MAIAFLLVFACACYGWGRMARCVFGTAPAPFAYDLALGVAILNFVGGVLNLAWLVSPIMLHAVTGVGVVASVVFFVRAARRHSAAAHDHGLRKFFTPQMAPIVLALLLSGFFAWTLLPVAALNIFDDFQTYLVRAVRMLSSGSLSGNPFDALGLDGFGGQSFFQSFALAWCPVTYINAFDGVFCFGLCALLIAAITRELNLNWGYAILGLLVLVSIPPQIANISPTYSGTAMILGLAIACARLAQNVEVDAVSTWRTVTPVCLFAACLVSLKSTLAMFAASQLLLFFAVLALRIPVRKRVIVAACWAAIGTFLLTLPWVIPIATTYQFAQDVVSRTGIQASGDPAIGSIVANDLKALFFPGELYYGGNRMSYNFAVLWATGLGIAAFFGLLRRKDAPALNAWLVSGGAAACSLPLLYVFNVHVFDVQTGIRYSCALIVAVFPLIALITAAYTASSVSRRVPLLRVLQLAGQFAIVFLFMATTATRIQKASNTRTQLAYALDQTDLDFNRVALSRDTARYLRSVQDKTAPGEGILVWMDVPFMLDFTRNHIFTASDPGIINPLLRFPAGVGFAELQTYIRSFGIRYVLFQPEGYSITSVPEFTAMESQEGPPVYKKIARYNIYAKHAFQALSERNRVLHRNSSFVLYELGTANEAVSQMTHQLLPQRTIGRP